MLPWVVTVFFWLLVGHAVADYGLQTGFLSQAKRPGGVPGFPWYEAMSAHCLIHAGAVALATGSVVLGIAEFCAHFAIDYAKCRGRTSTTEDQTLHVACKILWVVLLMAF